MPNDDPDVSVLLGASVRAIQEDPKAAKGRFRAAAQAAEGPCPSCFKVIRHRGGLAWCEDNEMSEAALQKRIQGRAKARGITVGHVGKAWVGNHETGEGHWITPMMEGWPDLFFMNPKAKGHKVFAMECKDQKGVVSDDQWRVLVMLNDCGIPAVVVRPADLRSGAVNAILDGK